MAELKLFSELNFIKNEIEKDLTVLDKIQNDLKLKVLYENNKELSDRVFTLTNDYNLRINELKNQNVGLEKEIGKMINVIGEKDTEISKLKENMRNLIEENRNLIMNLNKIKDDYIQMEKIVNGKEQEKELERRNKEYLRGFFEQEIRDLLK